MNPPTTEIRITLEDIFQTVCDLPPDRRDAYLDDVCAGNDDLRRQVENLLRHHETDGGFLENPVVEDAFKAIVTNEKREEEARLPMIGRQIGNYRVSALLGRGGMGEVYMARDAELGVDVVIKLLREEYKDDPEWMARFNREGRLNAELNHPNIAGIRYKGEVDGRQFLVFEFVAGETLESRLKKGPLPVKEALPLFSQLAEALDSAHGKGIIHRDLKPANLMLTPDGQLKVLDFGIAKKVTADLTTVEIILPEDELTTDFGKTRKGEVMGTVLYMSPEQTRGEPLDHRTDLWSFGCVFYEALSGKRPFGGVDVYDTLNAIRKDEPDWDALPAETPDAICELLKRCLRKAPYQRLASASEAQTAIAELISPSPKISLWQKITLASVALILLATSAFAGIWVRDWMKRRVVPEEKHIVVLPFLGFGNEQAGIGFADDLRQNLLRVSDDWQATPAAEVRQANLLSLDLQNLLRKLGANLIVSGEALQSGDQLKIKFRIQNSFLHTYAEEEISGASNQLAELQARIAERVADNLKLKKLPRATAYGQQLQLTSIQASEQYLIALGELQKDLNRESVEKPIEILTRLIQTEGDSARLQSALARACLNKFVFTTETEWAEKALRASDRAISLASEQTTLYRITRGLVYLEFGKNDEAISDFEAALAEYPRDWEALNGLAAAYAISGKSQQAEQTYLKAIAFWPRYWDGYNELGNFYYEQARFDKAIECWSRVVELLPDSPVGYKNLAAAYLESGRESDAILAFQNAISRDPGGSNYEAYVGLGVIAYDQQRYADALSYFTQAIDLASQSGRQQATLYGNRADAYRQLAGIETQPNLVEEYNRLADADFDQAISIKRQAIDSGATKSRFSYNLCEWLAKRGRTSEAVNCIKPAVMGDQEEAGLSYSATVVYLLAGDSERALRWFEKNACSGVNLDRLVKDPVLLPLQSQAAYQSIVSKCRQNNR